MNNQSMQSNIPFCSNCRIQLDENDEQVREHYKSEFHKYNIKRKLAGFTPATLEQFQDKKTKVFEQSRIIIEKQENVYCEFCKKAFKNDETFNQHLKSKKHIQNQKDQKDQKNQTQEIQIKKEIFSTLNDSSVCLFCDQKNQSLKNNLKHMKSAHSFFISEEGFCINEEGLLQYLAQKINKGFLCLYCENKGTKDFKCSQALKNHMLDKGHCFMNTDNFDEYAKFYDFSEQLQEINQYHNKNDKFKEHEIEIISSDDDSDEWQDSDCENDEQDQKEEFRGQMIKEKKKRQILRFRKAKLLDNGEILLPNGKTIGHRQYKIYYDQAIRSSGIKNYRYKQLFGQNYENRIQQIKQNDLRMTILKSVKSKFAVVSQRQDTIDLKLQKKYDLNKNLDCNKLAWFYKPYQNYG